MKLRPRILFYLKTQHCETNGAIMKFLTENGPSVEETTFFFWK